jgi:hypothetical protein
LYASNEPSSTFADLGAYKLESGRVSYAEDCV